jgi:hypothetical protein
VIGATVVGIPRGIDRDCADFATQPEAQAFFHSQSPADPHHLDVTALVARANRNP